MPPLTPSPLPSDKVGELAVACPPSAMTQSFDGQAVLVAYGEARVTGGQAQVEQSCSPESGSTFDIGTTTVVCSASDALQQTSACSLSVVVLAPPQLAATRFLAFGDSLTAGVVAQPIAGAVELDPLRSYPFRLQIDLAQRYLTQFIEVINAGVPGEQASEAVSRFQSLLGVHPPDVVLLMEGTNDLDLISGNGASAAASAIESMVIAAIAGGADVFLATIPPQRGTGSADSVPGYNSQIRSIAARRGTQLIDVFSIIQNGQCAVQSARRVQSSHGNPDPMPCLGDDGLHPTVEGYQLVADAFAAAIVERYDTMIEPSPATAVVPGDVTPAPPPERRAPTRPSSSSASIARGGR